MIRSVDEETLQDICREIALENYGFLYVNDHKDQIQSGYEGADTSFLEAGSISLSDIKDTLKSLTEDGVTGFERRRNGVYYYDPFETREGSRVSDELKSIFTYDLVINKETLETRFDIAPTDVDFFAQKLEGEDYVQRITAGEREYYVSGPRLKDKTSGDASVDSRLQEEAQRGTISHTDLEKVIDVAATDDVIRFLEKNDFVIDLDGEYLVKRALEDYASYLGGEIGEAVVEELGDVGVLPITEFNQVIRNEVDSRFDILVNFSGGDERSLIEEVREAIITDHNLTETPDLILDPERFERYVNQRATEIRDEIEAENRLATPSDYHELGHPRIEEIEISDSTRVNRYLQEQIMEKFNKLVEQRFETEDEN